MLSNWINRTWLCAETKKKDFWFQRYNDYNDYNGYDDYKDYNDYNNYTDYNNYNDYSDYNDYRDSDLESDLDLDWERFSE